MIEFLLIFFQTRSKILLTGILSILCGLILWEILSTYSMDYSHSEIVFYQIIGAILVLGGFALIIYHIRKKKLHEMDFEEDDSKRSYSKSLIDCYLRELTGYFMSEAITENMPIQKYVTQIHKNMLDLHKRRLERCHVLLEWKSLSRKYNGHAHDKKSYFDGKYEITEIDRQIESRRRYSRDHHKLMLRTDKEFAHYTVINAKKSGENEIICPNCGCVTSRENLIDGCDYCGARFTVEDLGRRISDFTLRDNVDLAYEKYKDRRLDRAESAFIVFFWAMFAFMTFVFMVLMLDDSSSGDPFNPILFVLSVVGIAASFAIIFAFCLMVAYVFILFPLMEIFTNVRYHSKKRVEAMKSHEEQEQSILKRIQENDPLFSLTGFYSNIQNKLSTLLYAENKEQFHAFSEEDISCYYDLYHNTIDYDIDDMYLMDYSIKDDLQVADLDIRLRLFELLPSAKKITVKKQHVKIQVIKSASSKTKAVCTPYVISCPNCGNSLSLLSGLICDHCGSRPDLKKYDWTIKNFKIDAK